MARFQKGHTPWNLRTTPGCGRPGHDTNFIDNRGKKSCRECFLARQRKCAKARHQRRRAAALAAYGGRCACCGEGREIFLAIDHINGGGNAHRRSIPGPSGSSASIYRWLEYQGYPPGFQVLCHNCNYAKHYGSCPHELESEVMPDDLPTS